MKIELNPPNLKTKQKGRSCNCVPNEKGALPMTTNLENQYITNFMFVEYEKEALTDKAKMFVNRFYGTYGFWQQTETVIQIGGHPDDVHLATDELREYGIVPSRVVFGDSGMEAMMA